MDSEELTPSSSSGVSTSGLTTVLDLAQCEEELVGKIKVTHRLPEMVTHGAQRIRTIVLEI
ncbi:hypothetical protein GN244_ATG01615 [Phytophthora infestans]|uniref:Uncharacterized protein n=1 Tax=Phytophthora infestans TaxID=4787 RepID=A0A833W7V5_PHYIN|nr:hypothetical protein GN244_ATG01615 [Phytophthora infestans]KAF4131901.1 hypothetical protein GN958_ATG18934 [Phytophthora infestans]